MKKTLAILMISVSLFGCASVKQKEQVTVVGQIQAVRTYQGFKKEPNLGGAAIGGVAGGVLGNQVGKGNGRTLATILGVVGGAAVGSQVGQKTVPVPMQELSVLMPDGRIVNINVESQSFFQGQNVEITTTQDGKAEIKAI